MADDADRAQQYEQIALERSLAFRERTGLRRTGACHNCGEKLEQDGLFCDESCEQDYRRLRQMRAQKVA